MHSRGSKNSHELELNLTVRLSLPFMNQATAFTGSGPEFVDLTKIIRSEAARGTWVFLRDDMH